MSHCFQDSFDHYTTFLQKWAAASSGSISTTYARTGVRGVTISGSGSIGQLRRTLLAAQEHATLILGIAIMRTSAGASGGMQFLSDAAATNHISIVVEADGSISVRRGTQTGTILAQTAAGVVAPDSAWHYLEAKCLLSDTVGTVAVQLDGVAVAALALSGADTKNAGTKTVFDGHSLIGNDTFYMDDCYVANGAGSVNNNFYGDTEVNCLLPIADGANTGFTPSTGSAHWSTIDESVPATADYVQATTDGTKDSYDVTALSNTSGTIRAVTTLLYAAKVGTEVKYVRPLARVASTDYEGASQVLATGHAYFSSIAEVSPATSAAWTPTIINASEYGFVAKDS